MSIRKTSKDHLRANARIELVENSILRSGGDGGPDHSGSLQASQNEIAESSPPSKFIAIAQSGRAFDFSELADGDSGFGRKTSKRFRGRPELLMELMPAIRDRAASSADATVAHMNSSLIHLWRTLDDAESQCTGNVRLTSVADLSHVHRQLLLDRNTSPSAFSIILLIVNATRLALGEKRLHWAGPPTRQRAVKHLPSPNDVKRVKDAMKRLWFQWRDKHDLCKFLLVLTKEEIERQHEQHLPLWRNLNHFARAQKEYRTAIPTIEQIGSIASSDLDYSDVCSYFFPDSTAIRAAFHLCLATTGWNPAVLISLKLDDEIFVTHPSDDSRYVMRGMKRRAKNTEQRCDGLKKSQHGPYSIINYLIDESKPLRDELIARKKAIDAQLPEIKCRTTAGNATFDLEQQRIQIVEKLSSLWLYFSTSALKARTKSDRILNLTHANFKTSKKGSVSFMQSVIEHITKVRGSPPLEVMTATDFRDAYALHWYEYSGGDILAVMRALNHRHVQTTLTYTNNVIVRVRNQAKARAVLKTWWDEVETTDQADSTIVAFRVKHGSASTEHRDRLKSYRQLMLTRLGTRCTDPHYPPSHIAPHFQADGTKVCDVHRCTLCVTHAVITPDSLEGLARRLVELIQIKSTMSIGAWQAASYDEEMENTEIALAGFDAKAAKASVDAWTEKIARGEYRVMPFESS